jgi:hypothetical protein
MPKEKIMDTPLEDVTPATDDDLARWMDELADNAYDAVPFYDEEGNPLAPEREPGNLFDSYEEDAA